MATAALLNAAENGDLERVDRLLRLAEADEDTDALEVVNAEQHGYTALTCAAMNGHCDTLRLLLQRAAQPDVGAQESRQDTALTAAAETLARYASLLRDLPKDEEVALVIQRLENTENADPMLVTEGGPKMCSPSWVAVLGAAGLDQQCLPVLVRLVERRHKAGLRYEFGEAIPVLLQALMRQQVDIMGALLVAGAAPDRRDDGGHSALMYCAEAGSVEGVEVLLAHGATRDIASDISWTPVMMASASVPQDGGLKVLECLLAERMRDPEHPVPDINWQAHKDHGYTALMVAAESGFQDCVELLLKCGASPDVQSSQGGTALMLAAQFRQFSIGKLLCEYGAVPTVQRDSGCNALTVSEVHGDQSLGHFLRSKGVVNPRLMTEEQKLMAAKLFDADSTPNS